jgi:hypothetical protein
VLEVFVVMKNSDPDCAFDTEGGAAAYCETRRRADELEWERSNPDAEPGSYSPRNAWAQHRVELKYV